MGWPIKYQLLKYLLAGWLERTQPVKGVRSDYLEWSLSFLSLFSLSVNTANTYTGRHAKSLCVSHRMVQGPHHLPPQVSSVSDMGLTMGEDESAHNQSWSGLKKYFLRTHLHVPHSVTLWEGPAGHPPHYADLWRQGILCQCSPTLEQPTTPICSAPSLPMPPLPSFASPNFC